MRTFIVNAYRNGFDKITLNYKGDEKDLNNLVNKYLLGFEVFRHDENTYQIESMTEPDYKDFDKLILKLFSILNGIMESLEKEDIEDQVNRMQRYDNFLKRAIVNNTLPARSPMALWQLLSDLIQVSKQCLHFSRVIEREFKEEELRYREKIKEMLYKLREAYLKKDLNLISRIHDMGEELMNREWGKKVRDPLYYYYLTSLARNTYLASNSLSGIIETKKI